MVAQNTKRDTDTNEGRIVRLESSQKALFNALENLSDNFDTFAQEVRRSIGGLQKGPNPQTMAAWAAVLLVVIGGIMWPVIREQTRLNEDIQAIEQRELKEAYQNGVRDSTIQMIREDIATTK